MTSLLLAGAAGLCCIAALLRLPPLVRRSSTLEQRAFCLALCGLAAGLTSQVPPVYRPWGSFPAYPTLASRSDMASC